MNLQSNRKPVVLIAEDDLDDKLILQVAFREFEDALDLVFVKDGEELMEYLLHQDSSPRPVVILLDLNMPKVDGRQALVEIKRRPDLKDIPIVIWTTSNEDDDRVFCAQRGAADYVTKPSDFIEMDAVIKNIVKTWVPILAGA